MTAVPRPPINDRMLDNNNLASEPWRNYFNKDWYGDSGTLWTPSWVNFSHSMTVTAKYYRISQYLCYFNIVIVPVTHTTTIAHTSYATFPLTILASSGFNVSISDRSIGTGISQFNPNRLILPHWTNVTQTITLSGVLEAT
jgi:hypothetical protein